MNVHHFMISFFLVIVRIVHLREWVNKWGDCMWWKKTLSSFYLLISTIFRQMIWLTKQNSRHNKSSLAFVSVVRGVAETDATMAYEWKRRNETISMLTRSSHAHQCMYACSKYTYAKSRVWQLDNVFAMIQSNQNIVVYLM